MITPPLLDPRDRQAILGRLRDLLGWYAPELRLDESNPGIADALVELFAGMHYETVQRLNRVPMKKFLTFLNLLEVQRAPATPATGYAQFLASPPGARGAAVARETRLLAEDSDGETIVYCTDSAFEAVSAQMTKLILVDPVEDCIEEAKPGEAVEFFRAHPDRNLQRHFFMLGHESLLEHNGACEVELRLVNAVEQFTEETAARLADSTAANWEYFDGAKWRGFDAARAEGSRLYLHKKAGSALLPFEEGGIPFLRCTSLGRCENLRLREALLRPALPEGTFLTPDELFFNDQPIDPTTGGFCFGRSPLAYDCFYIGADAALCKRGAVIRLHLEMVTTVVRQITAEQQYHFNKMIIDKNDKIATPEEIFVSETVWEYWNGAGWRRLETQKSENPFSCRRQGSFDVSFLCPADLTPVEVNAAEHLWIRARVALVENSASITGDKMLPFLKELRIDYAYEHLQRVQGIRMENNRESVALDCLGDTEYAGLSVFRVLESGASAVYVAFDQPLCGYPVNLYFELSRPCRVLGAVEVQVLTAQGFRKVNIADQTAGLTESGVLGIFLPDPPEKASLFGVEGYFIRLLGMRRENEAGTMISRILTNVTAIRQVQREEETFDVAVGEVGLELRLARAQVLSCQVWVEEREHGTIEWQQVDSLAGSSADSRHYCLDAVHGILTFGDGLRGMLPPSGTDAIRVRYTCGGGKRGNLPAGAISRLARSIPYVTDVVNVTAACGGSDWQSPALIEQLGPRRLRHGFRACCPGDYEDLVRERFGEVVGVRCFANTLPDGSEKIGMVTVVVEADGNGDDAYARQLCKRIQTMLEGCCDCMALDRLHVIPATIVTLHVTAWLAAEDYGFAAEIERDAEEIIRLQLQGSGRGTERLIGALPAVSEFYGALKKTPRVLAVREVSIEGAYRWNGEERLADLDGSQMIPFAVVRSGVHKIKLY